MELYHNHLVYQADMQIISKFVYIEIIVNTRQRLLFLLLYPMNKIKKTTGVNILGGMVND